MNTRNLVRRNTGRCSLGAAASPVVEQLEQRSLLSVSLQADGTLLVLGTKRYDDIGISICSDDATKLDVCVNGRWRQFDRDAVKAVMVNGGKGDDYLHVDDCPEQGQVLDIPVTLIGG